MDAIRPLADRDIQLMQILKNRLQSHGNYRSVAPWDVARLESKFKSEVYVIKWTSSEEICDLSSLAYRLIIKNIHRIFHWVPVWMD